MKKLFAKLNKKGLIIIGVALLLIIVGVGFGISKLGSSDVVDKSYTNNQVEKEEENKETEPSVNIVDLKSSTRPYAVMINNNVAARPYHSGLQDAYLVYEIVVEGGITRYMALFKDNYPEVLGSIRSARHYYLDYALENDAIFVHWGHSPKAAEDIRSLNIDHIAALSDESRTWPAYGEPYFYRYQELLSKVSLEHTGFANLKQIASLTEQKNYRLVTSKDLLLNYSANKIEAEVEGKEATKVDLKYSGSNTTNYVYDASSNVYKQSVNSKAHVDYQTNKQYTVTNIITYQVKNFSIDSYGRQDIENLGKGEGYFITGGVAYPITWEKISRSNQTVYKYKETGEEITVNDGNTWIHIVPQSGSISIS